MTQQYSRPDIARAFSHLVSLFDFSRLTAQEEILAAVRAGIERYGDVEPRPAEEGVTRTPVTVGALPAEWHCAPGARPDDRILYLHGGGLISGSLSSHRRIAAALARHSGCAVLNIDYRLAPEHTYPAAHDDTTQAFLWLADNGPDSAKPVRRLFIAGDSAGANLAMGTCARAIQESSRIPDALALLGPCIDNTANPNRPARTSDPIINDQAVAPMALYAAGLSPADARISPLFLADDVLRQFPPTIIQASAAEFLLPDAQALSARLAGLGRRHALSIWSDMPHDWHAFLDTLPEAQAAIAEAAGFLMAS